MTSDLTYAEVPGAIAQLLTDATEPDGHLP